MSECSAEPDEGAPRAEAFWLDVELHLREMHQAEILFRFRWLPAIATIVAACLFVAWLQAATLLLELAVCAVVVGATGWRPVRSARATVLEALYRVSDSQVTGVMAQMMFSDRRAFREAAGAMVLKLLPLTEPELGRSLSPRAVEGIVQVLRRGANAEQAVPALGMLSHRTEQCAWELAGWLAASPGGWWPFALLPRDEARIHTAAVAARASIDANRERLRQQETLLRPANEGAELALLRAATVADVPKEHLLRTATQQNGPSANSDTPAVNSTTTPN